MNTDTNDSIQNLRKKCLSLAEIVIQKLSESNQQLVVAESCTGGLLGSYITSVSGASNVFCGGLITYSNESKVALLNVLQKTIQEHGAVSSQTVLQMATNAIKIMPNATVSIAISGIAGPTGATPTKPLGTVFIAYCDAHRSQFQRFQIPGTRMQVQHESCVHAMEILLNNLNGR